jgi:aromatic ring-opening dioxygenase LigB subunit
VSAVLVFPCIAPHGGVSIESLGNPKADRAAGTRQAMAELRARAQAAAVEAWIVLAPHGIRAAGAMAISDGDRAISRIEPESPVGRAFTFEAPVQREMAAALAEYALAGGVPAVRIADGMGNYPMDWSGSIPLWFLGVGESHAPIVQVVPSIDLGWDGMVRFGALLAAFCAERPERIGLVASSDLAHAHDAAGPYGFDPAAAAYDGAVVEAIEADEPMRLRAFDPETVHAAKVDGQWQILILAGALKGQAMPLELLCYEVPTYFGMLTAGPRVA